MTNDYGIIYILGFLVLLAVGAVAIPSALYAVNKRMHGVILFLAEVFLAGMVIIVILTVILRYFFNTGIAWAEEVPRLLVGYFAFLACAMGVRDRTHMSMDLVYEAFPRNGKVRVVIDVFADLCVLACGLFMLYYGGLRILKMMPLPGVMPITRLPNWVRYAAVPVVGFAMLFDSVLFLTRVVKPGDLLFSEPEADYESQCIHETKGDK